MDRILKAARTSGSLNLSNRSLKDVPIEVYQCLETTGEGENCSGGDPNFPSFQSFSNAFSCDQVVS
ncbi:hypothetical protein ARALYDRAFT_920368 [Arabidopsis lyrata subsp. lyrata]|uniref:Uncharacterized protein n=1 Tax=Arabidopsis lyrata subsp. lyrata TaxID=81972 RepID=D7MWX1_ARALL|nr:hypothetical protein ARALYDRAFT_920368 [Arabidopsis lyrata subsp. lyrata]